MKLKKILAGVSAAALAASMSCAFSASAVTLDAGSIDFEDGDCSFVYMNVDDASADKSVLSVEDYDGSKQLKVDVQSASNAPKVWFDLDKIMPREKTVTIAQIDFDLTLVPKSADGIIGWAGGAVGAAGGFDLNAAGKGQKKPGWSQGDWTCEDENAYNPGQAAKTHVTRKFPLPNQKYSLEGTNPFFGLMRWASTEGEYVMYFDNIVFTDDKGKVITVGLPAVEETTAAETEAAPAEETTAAATEAAPAEETTAAATEAAPAETTAAPAETTAAATEAAPAETTAAATEAAPAETTAAAANTTTNVPATGNTTAAAIVAVMAVAGAAAVITKKRG